MAIPVLRQGDRLVASIQEEPSDADLRLLHDHLARDIGRLRARGVVLDVSALAVVDSFATRTLRDVVQTARLRGAHAVVVGIQPDVAFAMVQLGLTLDGIPTALDLGDAMDWLDRISPPRSRGGQ